MRVVSVSWFLSCACCLFKVLHTTYMCHCMADSFWIKFSSLHDSLSLNVVFVYSDFFSVYADFLHFVVALSTRMHVL